MRSGPLHQAIAQVGFRAIVTAWYGELLKEALRDAGCRVLRVGSFNDNEDGTRAVCRSFFGPNFRRIDRGLRVGVSVAAPFNTLRGT